MLHVEEKHNRTMSKAVGISSKLVSTQYQPINKGKTPKEA